MPNSQNFLTLENNANSGAFGHNPIPTPTEAQCQAGNYKLGRITLYGLSIAIEQPRGTYRTGIDEKTGIRWTSRMAAHYGFVAGTKGADGDGVDCFVGAFHQSEYAYVVNQNVNGVFDEHKIVFAYPDEASARQCYRDSYDRNWPGLASLVPASISQIKWWLKHGNMKKPLHPSDLPPEGLEAMSQLPQWSADALPTNQTIDQLLYDIRRSDSGENLMLDSVTLADIMEDSDGLLAFDALVVPFAALERKMTQLQKVMGRSSLTVNPVAMQVTEPFSQRGVANVAAIFEMSDGQTVSIYFHNPDVTPKKMMGTDEVISWKWLLNKKDITIVVAPERGTDLNINEVARRIMKLAEKNSAAFQRVNAKKAESMQRLGDLKAEITGLEKDLKTALNDLEVAKIEQEDRVAKAVETAKAEKLAAKVALYEIGCTSTKTGRWSKDGILSVSRADGGLYLWSVETSIQRSITNTVEVAFEWLSGVLSGMGDAVTGSDVDRTKVLSRLKFKSGEDLLNQAAPTVEVLAELGAPVPPADAPVAAGSNGENYAWAEKDIGYAPNRAKDKFYKLVSKTDSAIATAFGAKSKHSDMVQYFATPEDAGVWASANGYVFGPNPYAQGANLPLVQPPVVSAGDEKAEAEEEIPSVEPGQDGGKTGSMHTGPMPLVRSVGAEGLKTIPAPAEPVNPDAAPTKESLIEAYKAAWQTEADKVNALVVSVNWAGIVDAQSGDAEIKRIYSEFKLIGDIKAARKATEDAGYTAWNDLPDLGDVPGYHAHSAAMAEFHAVSEKVSAAIKAAIKKQGATDFANLPADAPIEDMAQVVYRKHGIETTGRGDYFELIIQAIKSKNGNFLQGIFGGVGSGNNVASMEVFERATGINLAKTAKDRSLQIDAWAGITPEARAQIEAEKEAAYQAKNVAEAVKDSWNYLTSMRVNSTSGAGVINGQEYVLELAASGSTEIKTVKKGVALVYGLAKPGDGSALSYLKTKSFTAFLKAASKFGGLQQAFDLVGAVVPEYQAPVDNMIVIKDVNGVDVTAEKAKYDAKVPTSVLIKVDVAGVPEGDYYGIELKLLRDGSFNIYRADGSVVLVKVDGQGDLGGNADRFITSSVRPKGMTEDQFRLAQYKQMKVDLASGIVKPSSVIGGGHKNPRKDADNYLDQKIAEYEGKAAADAPIELTGKELGDFPEGGDGYKALHTAAVAYFEDNLIGKSKFNASLRGDVFVRKSGSKKIAKLGSSRLKMKLVPATLSLIGKAVKQHSKPSSSAAERNIKAYHYMRVDAKVGAEIAKAWMIVKEDDKGMFLYEEFVNKGALTGIAGVANALDSTLLDGPALYQGTDETLTKDDEAVNGYGDFDESEAGEVFEPEFTALDSATGSQMVFNLFIEGEEPEVVEFEDDTPVEAKQAKPKVNVAKANSPTRAVIVQQDDGIGNITVHAQVDFGKGLERGFSGVDSVEHARAMLESQGVPSDQITVLEQEFDNKSKKFVAVVKPATPAEPVNPIVEPVSASAAPTPEPVAPVAPERIPQVVLDMGFKLLPALRAGAVQNEAAWKNSESAPYTKIVVAHRPNPDSYRVTMHHRIVTPFGENSTPVTDVGEFSSVESLVSALKSLMNVSPEVSNLPPVSPISAIKTHYVETSPIDVPADWIIMNAPRPLLGTQTIDNGEFLTGRYYAAIDPGDSMAAAYIKENIKQAAEMVLVAAMPVQIEMALEGAGEYRAAYEAMPTEKRINAVKPLIGRIQGKPYAEAKAFLEAARARVGRVEQSAPIQAPVAVTAPIDEIKWKNLKTDIMGSISAIASIDKGFSPGMDRSLFVSSIAGKIRRSLDRGELAMAGTALAFVAVAQDALPKPVFAPSNKLWKDVDWMPFAAQFAPIPTAAPDASTAISEAIDVAIDNIGDSVATGDGLTWAVSKASLQKMIAKTNAEGDKPYQKERIIAIQHLKEIAASAGTPVIRSDDGRDAQVEAVYEYNTNFTVLDAVRGVRLLCKKFKTPTKNMKDKMHSMAMDEAEGPVNHVDTDGMLFDLAIFESEFKGGDGARSVSEQPVPPSVSNDLNLGDKSEKVNTEKSNTLAGLIADRESEIDAKNSNYEAVKVQLGRELSAIDSKVMPVRNKGDKRDAINEKAAEARREHESDVREILNRYDLIIKAHPEEVSRRVESKRLADEMRLGMKKVDMNPQMTADKALFQSVIDGSAPDLIEPEMADKLEAAYNRHIGNADMEAMFEMAVNAYGDASLAASADL